MENDVLLDVKNEIGSDSVFNIVEVGANDGEDTEIMLRLFPNAKVSCFEPDPRAATQFRSKFSENPRVSLIEKAVSDKNGEVCLNLSSGNPGGDYQKYGNWTKSSSIKRPDIHLKMFPWCKFESSTKVSAITLDEWWEAAGRPNIDFLWADVQGAEEELIKGGEKMLNNVKMIYTEYYDFEMYSGQLPLAGILSLLPNFCVAKNYRYNVLLKNLNF